LAVGLAWYALVAGLGELLPEPWSDYRPPDELPARDWSLAHLELAISLLLGVFVPAWFFRRAFGSMRMDETVLASWLGLLMFVLCFTAAAFTLSLFGGVEEIEQTQTLVEKLLMSLGAVLFWSGWGVAGAVQAFYVFLPLSWLSILFLRWAGSGAERRESLTPRAT